MMWTVTYVVYFINPITTLRSYVCMCIINSAFIPWILLQRTWEPLLTSPCVVICSGGVIKTVGSTWNPLETLTRTLRLRRQSQTWMPGSCNVLLCCKLLCTLCITSNTLSKNITLFIVGFPQHWLLPLILRRNTFRKLSYIRIKQLELYNTVTQLILCSTCTGFHNNPHTIFHLTSTVVS